LRVDCGAVDVFRVSLVLSIVGRVARSCGE